MGAIIESTLAALVGERLRYIGRATDLVWVGIGGDVEAPDRHGDRRVLAEHALHLQCPWRLTRLGVPLVGSWDLHRSIGSNDWADGELLPGEAAFDPIAAELTVDAERSDHLVDAVAGNDWGGVSLAFSNGVVLDVLPVTTASDECWRYFNPGQDSEHFVIFEVPTDS
ncbi:MAG TPA: hypothetical protein VF244_10570 [Acidimicrobiales bacterium]